MSPIFDRKEDFGYIKWAQEIKRRDNYACVICNRKGVMLNSHHLNGWADFPAERYDVQNGVTLCQSCHDTFHEIYKKGGNTTAQFKEFEKIMDVIIRLANNDCIVSCTAKKMLQTAEKDRAVQEIITHLDGYYAQNIEKDNYNEDGYE
jgi:protein-arginine kinase activator protein McsA